jgi:hypothetical protein
MGMRRIMRRICIQSCPGLFQHPNVICSVPRPGDTISGIPSVCVTFQLACLVKSAEIRAMWMHIDTGRERAISKRSWL